MQTQDTEQQTEQQIAKILDDLANAQAQRDILRLSMEAAIAAAMPPEVAAAIEGIRAGAEDGIAAAEAHIAELTALAKKATGSYGKSVKGGWLHAVFSMRTSWDGKGLNGYAVAHPEILAFRKRSTSVSIRRKR